MIIPLAWAGLAGGLAVFVEFQYRNGLEWWPNLWWLVPLLLLLNFAIYQLLRSDLGWLPSIVIFGAVTAGLRIALTFAVLHEPTTPGNLAAGVLLMLGAALRIFWR